MFCTDLLLPVGAVLAVVVHVIAGVRKLTSLNLTSTVYALT